MKNSPLDHYPIFLDLKDRDVIVIGGGLVAERKVRMLIKSGADVTVISPRFTARLTEWGKHHKITIIQRPYREGDLHQSVLAFTTTDRPEVNEAVALEARQKKIWINVADQSTPGNFIVPAVFSKPTFTIAVSSHGKNPALAVKIRDRLEACLNKESSKQV